MKLLFTPEALASYNQVKAASTHEAQQIKDIIKDILVHPDTGKGAPEALTGALAGLWSREYGFSRQIVYQILPDEVKIYALGKNVLPGGDAPSSDFKQTSYSGDEYRSVLAQMAANRGKGLEEFPQVYDMIIKEFNLPPERTLAKYAVHWDIGHSWR